MAVSGNVYQIRKHFATVAAQSRLEALNAEIDAIKRAFPGITPAEVAATIANHRQTGSYTNTPPKRKGMSAAQRKAVSIRMKAYWAGRRKANKKGKVDTAK